MKLSSIITILIFLISIEYTQQQQQCTTPNIESCTSQNVICIQNSSSDIQKCTCIRTYATCLENLGCDPDEHTGGGNGHHPGNANGQFDAIRQSCIAYSCEKDGICEVKSPSSATTYGLSLVWLIVFFVL